MSGDRATILGRLRQSLGKGRGRRDDAVEEWLARRGRGPLPAVGDDLTARFVAQAEAAFATVERVRSDAEIVARIRAGVPAGASLAAAPHPRLASLPWPAADTPPAGTATAEDTVGVVAATAGIAETGSLAFLTGRHFPAALGLLPDHLFCLLEAHAIVTHPEDLWARLRADGQVMPRALQLVTGPSRTADVEQTMQLGAHGPRRLTILLAG